MTSNRIVLIGARGGSKRIPRKNLQIIGEYPLIEYSIRTGQYLGYPTWVSTEDDEIARVSDRAGALIHRRTYTTASDTATDYDWIIEFLHEVSDIPSEIVFLRPTTPFRCVFTVQKGLDSFKPEFDSLRACQALNDPVEKCFRVNNDELEPIFKDLDTNSPSQKYATSYTANGYVDILRTDVIMKQGNLYGKKIQAFVTPKVIEIDSMEDLELANRMVDYD